GKPVDVPDQNGIGRRRERNHAALGTAADGACNMQRRPSRGAACQYEPAQGRQLRFEPIDQLFEPLDVSVAERRLADALRDPIARVRKLRAESEEVLLNLDERLV